MTDLDPRTVEKVARVLRTDLAQARFVDPQMFDSEDARITAHAALAALSPSDLLRAVFTEEEREAIVTAMAFGTPWPEPPEIKSALAKLRGSDVEGMHEDCQFGMCDYPNCVRCGSDVEEG